MTESSDKAKILVLEDKDFEERKIVDTLQTDEHDITPIQTGLELMEKIASETYDLIVISLNLENEDGLRLCSHLRSNEATRTTPILMIGEEQDMERIAHGLEIGAHDYILRPVERSEMMARVRTQIRRKRFQERLKSSYEISLSMALTDSLTGLYNRRYLEVHMEKLLEKNRHDRKSLAVLMVDIDHFKSVNDTYGHNVGDEILKIFAQRLKDGLRPTDLVARLGGEEFTVILPDVTKERAHMVAERLRRNIAQDPITCSTPDGCLKITTSIGGAMIDFEPHTVQEALERADKMLYEAKENGRNCCFFEKDGKLDPETVPVRERPRDEL